MAYCILTIFLQLKQAHGQVNLMISFVKITLLTQPQLRV